MKKKKNNGPNILLFDIETLPIIVWTWGIWDQKITPGQIMEDWSILSWSAKWLESEDKKIVYGPHRKVMYMDQRKKSDVRDDKALCKEMHTLLDEADIVITQNGKAFDAKKLNARFIKHKMPPPSPYKHIDTKQIAKRVFAFTSNSLGDMTEFLEVETKKMKNSGISLWLRCMKGEIKAFNEMKAYNITDTVALEGLFHKLQPWDQSAPNFNLYMKEDKEIACNCGNSKLQRRGYSYTSSGRYQRYQCTACGAWSRGKQNMITKDRRDLLKGKA